MTAFQPHPGYVQLVDRFEGTSRDVPVEQLSVAKRFIYLRDGVEVEDEADADERIPIVVIETISTDGNGRLVPPEDAYSIRVVERGPDRRTLRVTLRKPIR